MMERAATTIFSLSANEAFGAGAGCLDFTEEEEEEEEEEEKEEDEDVTNGKNDSNQLT
jgi:hypothetical protein